MPERARVVNAVKVAKARGLHTLTLTGSTGGKLVPLCDVRVHHALCAMIEAEFFASMRARLEEFTYIKHVYFDLTGLARKSWYYQVYGKK